MEKKMIVCGTSYDFVMGGVPTYFMRIFEWAISEGYDKALLIPKNREIDNIWRKKIDELHLKIIRYSISINGIQLIGIENDYDEIIFIVSDLHCYFRLFYYKNFNNISNMKVFFYCLHPHATTVEKHKLFNLPYKKLIKNSCNHDILFMDRETKKFCEQYYSLEIKNSEFYRIGIFFQNLDEDNVKIRTQNRKDKFVVLTIARIEFPFKGYILGLINTIAILEKEYPNLFLKVIGDGPDIDLVQKELKKLPLIIRNKISLLGEVPYDELQQYYKNASLYVGMGTSLIEAAQNGVPSIVATAFQNGDSSIGFFDDEYDNVGGNIQLSSHEGVTLEKCIRQELEKDDIQYKEHCYNSYYICRKYYQIDNVMNHILKIEQKSHSNISKYKFLNIYDYFMIKMKIRIQNRRKRRS